VSATKVYTVEATMDQIVMIHAQDWPSAFQSLFREWNPEPDAGAPQIPGRTGLPRAAERSS
jgi:hypothetical protein